MRTYLARHDQDDVSHTDRLRHQIAFLSDNPDTVVVGTWVNHRSYDSVGYRDKRPRRQHPVSDSNIRLLLCWNSPFVHGSVMMRRSAFDECGRYSESSLLTPPEDYELWVRMSKFGRLANIPKRLLTYQVNPDGMSYRRSEEIGRKLLLTSRPYVSEITAEPMPQTLDSSLAILNGKHSSTFGLHDYLRASHLVVMLSKSIKNRSLLVGQIAYISEESRNN